MLQTSAKQSYFKNILVTEGAKGWSVDDLKITQTGQPNLTDIRGAGNQPSWVGEADVFEFFPQI